MSSEIANGSYKSLRVDFQESLLSIFSMLKRPAERCKGKIPLESQPEVVSLILETLKTPNKDYVWYIELPFSLSSENEFILGKGIRVLNPSDALATGIDEANQLTDLTPIIPTFLTFEEERGLTHDQLVSDHTKNSPTYDRLNTQGAYVKVRTKGFAAASVVSTLGVDPVHIWNIIVARLFVNGNLVNSSYLKYLSKLQENSSFREDE